MKLKEIQPVFILGNPRSGTSLFRLMLNAHANIVATPECGFSHWLLNRYGDWTVDHIHSGRLEEFIKDLQNAKKFETWHLEDEEIKQIIYQHKPKNYSELICCVHLSYAEKPDDISIVADKNNYYINHIDDLPKIWPTAKYIHIIRDGRDVACSYKDIKKINTESKYIPKLTTDIREIAIEWKNNNNRIASIKDWNPDNYLLIRFEDLILNTKPTLNNLMQFLDLTFDKEMLEYFKGPQKSQEPTETLAWKTKTQEKPDRDRVGRYKKILTNEEVVEFEKKSSMLLKKYDY